MKYNSTIITIVVLALCFSCKEKPKETTEKDIVTTETTENWKSLFNGKNLDGWLVKINGYELNNNYNNTFRAEDGVLKVSYDDYENFTDEFGHIFYKTPFSNYKFRLQYRFVGNQVKGGEDWAKKNSGIMLHCQSPESMLVKQGFPLSLEAQLLGGVNKDEPRSTGNLCTPATHVVINGELNTEHCISANSETYYGEEWITAEVVVNNDSITHFINGKPVISYSNPTIGGEFLDTTAKEIQAKDGQPLTSGYISLQSESHPIEFKNIEILEL
ncbi:DUF1080 domain-containing protein [Flaviramulus sp. BrNp1-15]|uniref:3-keto-disaccharide hydrolase n=1 Tax=Flaviramulus sp. BrNp1-15 TaxID=2916754 RepID=UPI001EE97CA9|nr:DUF1080 domain-containing protein [Flaviramulus sp. BrNp1-15]ULC59324.1 DUF1080 domain-containing protein [Flaviramulus sp. BrNp1-15]